MAGRLAEVDAEGRLVRASSSTDSAFPGAAIRTYALEALPGIDRVLTTSSPMDTGRTADVVQIWRLSDLALLKTIPMPGIPGDSVERSLRNPCACRRQDGAAQYLYLPLLPFDISDPAHPVEVSALATDSSFFPHWIAADPGSNRLVVTEQGDGAPRILMIRLDPATGGLSWDERFQEADSTARGVSFSPARWPNGVTGPAMPHRALLVP